MDGDTLAISANYLDATNSNSVRRRAENLQAGDANWGLAEWLNNGGLKEGEVLPQSEVDRAFGDWTGG